MIVWTQNNPRIGPPSWVAKIGPFTVGSVNYNLNRERHSTKADNYVAAAQFFAKRLSATADSEDELKTWVEQKIAEGMAAAGFVQKAPLMDERTRKALNAIVEAAINARMVLDHYRKLHEAGYPLRDNAAHNAVMEINMALEEVSKLETGNDPSP